MNSGNELEILQQKLRAYFQNSKSDDIISVYLFGSRIVGPHAEDSDLDIGILMRAGYLLPNDTLFTLMEDIATIVHPLVPDVKILNELPVRIQHNVLKNAQQIYCADEIADADFREDLFQKYFELKPILQEFYDAL
ncbi:MAG TPA: nucleotidyltransferase domain-containing protein [Candidatus Lokiarchaeia archaeon]|nr:nucleotidyltransferase domain-containing protein [Candidatus Lokiarchaeia archaeon]